MKAALGKIGYGFLGAVLFALLAGGVAVALDPAKGLGIFRLDGTLVGQSARLKISDGFLQPTFDGQGLSLGAGPSALLDGDANGCIGGTDSVLCSTLDNRGRTVYDPTTSTRPVNNAQCTAVDTPHDCCTGSGTGTCECTVGECRNVSASAKGAAVYCCEDNDGGSATLGTWARSGRVFTMIASAGGTTASAGLSVSTATTEYFRIVGDTSTLITTAADAHRPPPFNNAVFWAVCCVLEIDPVTANSVRTFTLESDLAVAVTSVAIEAGTFWDCSATDTGWTPANASKLRYKSTVSGANALTVSDVTCIAYGTAPTSLAGF